MKNIVSLIFILSLGFNAISQEYWQQHVAYDIDVKLDDKNHFLRASEGIVYTNNSPDALSEIYMHIWPNAYKNLETAMSKQLLRNGNTNMYFIDENGRGYIDSLDFKVDGQTVEWKYDAEHIDICILQLKQALQPGQSITISTPFKVKIPSGVISRLGHVGQSYQITQWYPKPAVYDKNGWNPMPYLTQGEFYSEFGTFDVKITLPENYVLGATGDMQGESAIKEYEWLSKKAEETEKITEFPNDMSFPESSKAMKTLHFHQENVHDFGWFADKRWHVLKSEVKLPHTGDFVTTWAYFTNSEADLWKKSTTYLNDAVYYYSLWNGDYPYNHCTAVDGTISAGGGMEYPNITVIGSSGSDFMLETVIMHEVGHNWFYGILGSNEREHAWMDEGLNSYNEKRYLTTKYPDASIGKMLGVGGNQVLGKVLPKYKDIYWLQYYLAARSFSDQPIETHSDEFSSINYGVIVYAKTAASMHYLSKYLGQELFDDCMKAYYRKWKFKHPQPEDLQQVFEDISGENLDWFFVDLIQQDQILDYGIGYVKSSSNKDSILVTIKNKGNLVSPFSITAYKGNTKVAKAWYSGIEDKAVVNFPNTSFDRLVINDNTESTEVYLDNNYYKNKSFISRIEPIKFEFLGNVENPKKNQVYWTPVLGWNKVDGGQVGFALYNQFLPKERFSWHFMPLVSNGSKSLNGSFGLQYSWRRPLNNMVNRITVGNKFRKYGFRTLENDTTRFYTRNALFMDIHLKSKWNKNFKHTITSELINVDLFDGTKANNLVSNSYYRIQYNLKNGKPLFPHSWNLRFENNGANRLSSTFKFKFYYHNVKKAKVEVRTFAGYILGNSNTLTNFKLSGWRGYQDILLDHFYANRGTTDLGSVLARQTVLNDGGFVTPFFTGQTPWMVSNNIFIELPYFKKIRGFLNTAYLPNNLNINQDPSFEYEAGIQLNIIPDKFTVMFPIMLSDNLETSASAITSGYAERIRFTLNLETLSLFNLIDHIEL